MYVLYTDGNIKKKILFDSKKKIWYYIYKIQKYFEIKKKMFNCVRKKKVYICSVYFV